jgi:prepilin peptidase CpaA
MLQTLSLCLLPSLMIVAALSDVTSFRIPNWLTGLTAVLFFPMALLTGMPLPEFGLHVLAGAILFVLGYILFALRLFGGGDAKMMAAAGLWFGTTQSMEFLILTSLAGGLLAAAIAGWSAFMFFWDFHGPEVDGFVSGNIKKIKPKLPYGFAICVGAILAFPQSWWMTSV